MSYEVREFIKNNWDSCIKENTKTDGTLIGMPYPYTVPAVGHFDEMYYWDTYFTNKGLEIEGRYEQARNNTDNMLFLIGKFGYMPNGNRTYYLNRSQPPFLSLMVRDVYEHYNDKEWLKNAYKGLKAEYRFWTSRRGSPVGLSHYDYESSIYDHTGMANGFVHRAGFRPEGIAEYRLGRHFASTAESGWDITPRFGYEGYNCAAVDLNSLLYMLEKNLEFFAEELGNGESEEWGRYAEERKFCMNRYMLNEDGLFVDYNFASTTQSKIFSVASIYPLFAGLATKEQAEAVVNEAKAYQNAKLPEAQAAADKLIQNAQYLKQNRINEAVEQVALFKAMYEEYALNPEITLSRMYYEAISKILPGVKVYVNTGSGDSMNMILPLDKMIGGQ